MTLTIHYFQTRSGESTHSLRTYVSSSPTTPIQHYNTTNAITTTTNEVSGSYTIGANEADFGGTFPSGTVTFLPGETSETITISVSGDTTFEVDDKFTVTLSNPSAGIKIATALATGAILNDDASLSISPTDARKPEGNSGTTEFTFTVMRAGYTGGATTVNYAVTGSGANPANAEDFSTAAFPSGTISFAPSETSKTITIGVRGDSSTEPNESFTVTLSNIERSSAVGKIFEDDDGSIDLGTLGGRYTYLTDINNRGQVVGASDISADFRHAFLYSDGIMTDLGTLSGTNFNIDGTVQTVSAAVGINDGGQIVGYSHTNDNDGGPIHAFLYNAGVMTDLGTLGGSNSVAIAINNSG